MKAFIEQGVVTALVSGDIDGGVELPPGLAVGVGWRYQDELFSPAPDSLGAEPQQPLLQAERDWRRTTLAGTDWLVARHRDELDAGAPATLGRKQFAKLLAYRQALRDWPASAGESQTQARPEPPKWLAQLPR
ncbi:phage tail assembly chaperone [Pseudomonas piscis]|uniref:Phage tail assembly chaperone n=1 Tax=Pseudomonas piscis TaxID=2614538 RepID=A0ABY9NKG0_9PSED|nr:MULTISPECIES: phage tail assembly chaperone [Pseudomonas]WMN19006.1 phage tail assembly chaperone [Pseudomonas piscis]